MAVMSGSLIQASTTHADVTMADLEEKMTTLCKTVFSEEALGFAVRDIEKNYEAMFRTHAKFWTLQGICAILAYPKFYKNKISFYLAMAESCPDYNVAVCREFYEKLQAEIQRRLHANVTLQQASKLLYPSVAQHARLELSKLQ
jgi:hypothetical protein